MYTVESAGGRAACPAHWQYCVRLNSEKLHSEIVLNNPTQELKKHNCTRKRTRSVHFPLVTCGVSKASEGQSWAEAETKEALLTREYFQFLKLLGPETQLSFDQTEVSTILRRRMTRHARQDISTRLQHCFYLLLLLQDHGLRITSLALGSEGTVSNCPTVHKNS
jgi:hypothetical protein